MSVDVRWLGTACFQMVLPGGIHIMLDPYMDDAHNCPVASEEIEGCDYIFLTHGHWDHVLDVGKLSKKFAPAIFCNQTCASTIVKHQQVDPALIHTLTAGERIDRPGFTVDILPGVHTNAAAEYRRLTGKTLPGPDLFDNPLQRLKAIKRLTSGTDQFPEMYPTWRSMYPPGDQLNFVFECEDGQRLYVAGSYPATSVIETAKQAKATITLLQCMSADKLKGIEQKTADVAINSGCRTVVPQHHDPLFPDGRKTDLSELKRIFRRQADMIFLEMVPGAWYTFTDGIGHLRS